jgi:hypothetical protein
VSSTDDEARSAYLDLTRQRAEQRLHADDPYDVGLQFISHTVNVLTTGEYAGNMCALWGALTDWVELKPAEQDRARAEMIRAARDWLTLNPRDCDA